MFLDLNKLETRQPRQRLSIESSGGSEYCVKVQPDLADHVLAVGPRYQIDDIRCGVASHLGQNTSGVLRKHNKKN